MLNRRPGANANTGPTSELLSWCMVALLGFGSFSRFVQLVESKYPMESEELVAGEHQHLKSTCRSRTRRNFYLMQILLFCDCFSIPSLDARDSDSVAKVKL